MTIDEVKDKINKTEALMATIENQLIELRNNLIQEYSVYFRAQIKIRIDDAVKNCPDVTKRLAEEDKLKELKSSMEELQQQAGEIILNLFNIKDVLNHHNLHLQYKKGYDGYCYYEDISKILKNKILLSASVNIGEILLKYGYLTKSYGNYNIGWDYQLQYSNIDYDIKSNEFSVLKFSQKYADLLETQNDLLEYNSEKNKLEAKDLWDNL